jgi:hypothetical protein
MAHEAPHFAHGIERARLLLEQHRLAELTFDDLSDAERGEVRSALRMLRRRAHQRSVRERFSAAVIGVVGLGAVTVGFLAGPAAHLSDSGNAMVMGDLSLEAPAWLLGVGGLTIGVFLLDRSVRRHRRAARRWDADEALVAHTLQRAGEAG